MKILIVHNKYVHHGGEEAVVGNDISLLEQGGHTVVKFFKDNSAVAGSSLFTKIWLFFESLFSFKVYRELRDVIRQHKPDIAHVHNIIPLLSPSVFFALKKEAIPVIQTIHNYHFFCVNGLLFRKGHICKQCLEKNNYFYGFIFRCYRGSYMASFARSLNLFLHRKILKTYKKIDCFLCPSQFAAKKMIESGIDAEKVVVQHHWTNFDRIEPVYQHQEYCLYAGRLSSEKGLAHLIQEWKNCEYELRIAGEGPELNNLKDIVSKNGINNVVFLGKLAGDSYIDLLRSAVCLIVPSIWYENAPNVVIEGLASATPVMVADMGGLPTMVADGGGTVFSTNQYEVMWDEIDRLFNNREYYEKKAWSARKNFERNFSFHVIRSKRIELYERVINNYIK